MSANMIINTASVVGYNNKLKQAVSGTRLGVNNGVNTDTKKGRAETNARRAVKNQPPNSHPSNAVHRYGQQKMKPPVDHPNQ